MKKYLNTELKRIEKQIKTENNNEQIINLKKTKKNINKILENKGIDYSFLSNVDIKKQYNFIKELVDICANMQLLETELPIDYPNLTTRKNINKEDILYFLNDIYNIELPEYSKPFFNIENLKIFNHSFINRALGNGKCVIYNNYYTDKSIILLNRYVNVKDYIIPASKSILAVPNITNYFKNQPQVLYLMEFYLLNRAQIALEKTNYQKDAIKFKLIRHDNFVINARAMKRLITNYNYEELDEEQLLYLVDFYYEILAKVLSMNDNTTLYDICNTSYSYDSKEYMNNLSINETEVINKVKTISNQIKTTY